MKPLRVLYFIGSYGPDVMGNASHEEIIVALRHRGHEVDVLTQINQPGVARYTRAVYSGVPVYQVNLATSGGVIPGALRKLSSRFFQYDYMATLLAAYRRHLRSNHYDLVHVEGAYPFGFIAALGSGHTPYMANVQGADVIDLPEADYGYRRFGIPRAAVSFALRRAALVRSISPLLVDYMEQEGLVSRDRVVVVMRALEEKAFPPPGVSLQELRAEGRKKVSSRYGIGLPRPVVIALSRLHPFKGLEYLVDAIPIVNAAQRQRGGEPPWFVIAGPSRTTENYGDYRQFLRNRAEQLGVSSYIHFTGQIPHSEVRDDLAGADIFACPTIIEAQNKVVPEACAVGTPAVVTETTGIASYLKPLDACIQVPPRSAQALADGIISLLSDRELYATMQHNALRAADTLRLDAIAPQLEAAWERAAKE